MSIIITAGCLLTKGDYVRHPTGAVGARGSRASRSPVGNDLGGERVPAARSAPWVARPARSSQLAQGYSAPERDRIVAGEGRTIRTARIVPGLDAPGPDA